MRVESDKFGQMEIPDEAYRGIHTYRAMRNFQISGYKTPAGLIHAMADVKKAACRANCQLGCIPAEKAEAITAACDEVRAGKLDSEFPIDALQGGAGTSTNMNLNEVIANRALEILGRQKGEYDHVHPIEDVNLHQSTNDVYPTALRIAAIRGVRNLSEAAALLQGAFQSKEKEFAHIVCMGRTEMQDAVPMTLGSQFSGHAEAIARDRWRAFKCEERLRTVNIGGTAVGTGLTAPRKYIFLVIEKLREITGLGLTRAEQNVDATANIDQLVEVSGIIGALAANLMKIAGDLRLLHFLKEIELPALQTGSSIMPGKVNPVIIEAVTCAGMKVLANGGMIAECASRGTLQINEFMPLVAFALLESIEIMSKTCRTFAGHVEGITADEAACRRNFENNPSIITAFLPELGYGKCEKMLEEFRGLSGMNFIEYLEKELGRETVEKCLSPHRLIALGYK